MAAPPIAERHRHNFHRQSPIKESVRVATTANITIATALNAGDTLDGITLAADDRVLVKDQTSGAENGIYVVAASPARAYDVSTDDPAFGYLVLVRAGTANAGTTWANTNVSVPTIGTTALTFAAVGGGGGSGTVHTVKDEGTDLSTAVTSIDFVGAGVTATGTTAVTVTIPGGGSGITVQDEGSPLATSATTLDFVGAGVVASGVGATKTITIGGGGTSELVELANSTLGVAAADMTVTALSSSYRDLIVVVKARGTSAGTLAISLRVGSGSIDTGSNYSYYRNYAGFSAGNVTSASATSADVGGGCPGSTATAGAFGHTELHIINYASTSHWRSWIGQSYQHSADGILYSDFGGLWKNTAGAIDQVRVIPSGGNFEIGSSLTVYGRG